MRVTYFFNKTRTYRSLGNFKVGNLGEQHMQESPNGEAESTTFINYIEGKKKKKQNMVRSKFFCWGVYNITHGFISPGF